MHQEKIGMKMKIGNANVERGLGERERKKEKREEKREEKEKNLK